MTLTFIAAAICLVLATEVTAQVVTDSSGTRVATYGASDRPPGRWRVS